MPLEISIAERRAIAALVARIAERDHRLAEHALACGALSATLARMLDLGASQIATSAVLGTLHEVGVLAGEGEPMHEDRTARMRAHTVAIVRADPELAHRSAAVGALFDDVVPAPEARIVIVADIYDALVRHMPGVEGLTKRGALDVLKALVGTRIDADVVHALIFSQRRQRRFEVSA